MISLWVFPKTLDLHCVSAQEALVDYMGKSSLIHLRRFKLWTLSFEELTPDEEVAYLNTMIQSSFVLLNPNKEGFLMNALSRPFISGDLSLIKVTPLVADRSSDVLQYLNSRFGAHLTGLEESIVWEIGTKGALDIVSELVSSTSRRAGVLANPLFERVEVLSLDAYHD